MMMMNVLKILISTVLGIMMIGHRHGSSCIDGRMHVSVVVVTATAQVLTQLPCTRLCAVIVANASSCCCVRKIIMKTNFLPVQ